MKRCTTSSLCPVVLCLLALSGASFGQASSERIGGILDTDANNHLDDQHAIDYLLLNGDAFDAEAIPRLKGQGGVWDFLADFWETGGPFFDAGRFVERWRRR